MVFRNLPCSRPGSAGLSGFRDRYLPRLVEDPRRRHRDMFCLPVAASSVWSLAVWTTAENNTSRPGSLRFKALWAAAWASRIALPVECWLWNAHSQPELSSLTSLAHLPPVCAQPLTSLTHLSPLCARPLTFLHSRMPEVRRRAMS